MTWLHQSGRFAAAGGAVPRTDRYEAENATTSGSWTPDGPFGGSSGTYLISAATGATVTFAVTVPGGSTATLVLGVMTKFGFSRYGVSADGGTEQIVADPGGSDFVAAQVAVPVITLSAGAHSVVVRETGGAGADARLDYLDVHIS